MIGLGRVGSLPIIDWFFLKPVVSLVLIWLLFGRLVLCLLMSKLTKPFLWWGVFFVILFAFSSSNLFFFYVLFEFSLVPILLIIMFWGRQPERLSAGLYFLLYTGMVSIPYLFFLLFLFPRGNEFSFRGFIGRRIFSFLLLLPFLVKMPVFGLHFWLPKAHVEASTRGSIVLAGLLLKLGSFGVFQIISIFISPLVTTWVSFWFFRSIFRSIVTCVQSDLKKLVAYRRVRHITFILVGASSDGVLLYIRIALLSLAHGWAAIGLFLMAGVVRQASSSRLNLIVFSSRKIHLFNMLVGGMLIINASIPPIPSFFPELFIVIRLSKISLTLVVGAFVLLRILVCYFNCLLYINIRHKAPQEILCRKIMYVENFTLFQLIVLSIFSLLWLNFF